jgi:hypothetical protein
MSESLRLRLIDMRNKRVYDLRQYQAKQTSGKAKPNPTHNEQESVLIALLDELLAEAQGEAADAPASGAGAAYTPLLNALLASVEADGNANGFELSVQTKPGRVFSPVVYFRPHDTYIEHRLTRREREAQVKAQHEKLFGHMHWYNVSHHERAYINGTSDYLPNAKGAH